VAKEPAGDGIAGAHFTFSQDEAVGAAHATGSRRRPGGGRGKAPEVVFSGLVFDSSPEDGIV
jgi:hypothetical protein